MVSLTYDGHTVHESMVGSARRREDLRYSSDHDQLQNIYARFTTANRVLVANESVSYNNVGGNDASQRNLDSCNEHIGP